VRLLDWWWRAANDLILKYEVEEGHVAEAVRRANTLPRAGALEALRRCVDQGIPVLIISAGFSHVIREFVRLHDPDLAASPLLEIHANHMVRSALSVTVHVAVACAEEPPSARAPCPAPAPQAAAAGLSALTAGAPAPAGRSSTGRGGCARSGIRSSSSPPRTR